MSAAAWLTVAVAVAEGEPRSAAPPLWQAPFSGGAAGFEVERMDGAEGSVEFLADGIRVRKTNSAGAIVIAARTPFRCVGKTGPRTFAETEVVDADPARSLGFLRLWSGERNLCHFSSGAYGPSPQNDFLIAGTVRKFARAAAESTRGPDFTAAIVVAGAPSESVWKDWGAEDIAVAAETWREYKARLWKAGVRNHSAETFPEAEFAAALAGDTEHVAKVEKRGGYSVLTVDGAEVPPVFYKGYGGPFAFCGKRMQEKAGVKLQYASVTFGGRKTNDPGIHPYWTAEGFDVTGAVREVRRSLKAAMDSYFILGIAVNPYPDFAKEHPEERWIGPDGSPVYGHGCVVAPDQSAAAKDPQAWIMVSQFSERWREEAKKHIAALIAELKRTGLSKRIVGVHISGSHDGQFGMPVYDYSPMARRAYRSFMSERYGSPFTGEPPDFSRYGDAETGPDFLIGEENRELVDFQEFIHHASVGIQEDLARHAKHCFGKDIVAIKYCLSVFEGLRTGEFDFARFLESDAIDILAAQSCYKRRPPGIPMPEQRVAASFHEHGKLLVSEFDFEAYHRGPAFCRDELAAMDWGYLADFPRWQEANRRAAGQMMALRQGFWYYDMGGDYFDDDRMLGDIREVVKTAAEYYPGKKSAWHPDAAVVLDERGMMYRNISRGSHGTIVDERESVPEQLALLEMSGVPFDMRLLDDFLPAGQRGRDGARPSQGGPTSVSAGQCGRDGARPSQGGPTSVSAALAKGYRTVFLLGAYRLDERRLELLRRLADAGTTVILGSGTGIAGGARELGFELAVIPRQSAPGHEQDSGGGFFATEALRVALAAKPGSAKYAVRRPHRISVRPAANLEILARYAADGAPSIVSRREGAGRFVYICDQIGLTPELFNRLVKESGGYVAGEAGRVQLDLNGDFLSVHALRSGAYEIELPFAAEVTNLRSGSPEPVSGRTLPLTLSAGTTYWFRLSAVLAAVAASGAGANAQVKAGAPKPAPLFKGIRDPADPMPADRAAVLAELAKLPPAAAEVRELNGKPALYVDGRHWPVNMYKGDYDYRLMGEAGGDLVLSHNQGARLYASVKWDPACWDAKAGRFDFSRVEDNLIRIHHHNPRARVILTVEVSPDRDFLEAHPDELLRNEKGELGNVRNYAFRGFDKGPLGSDPIEYHAFSYTGAAYREYIAKGLVALADFLKRSPAGNIVIGFGFSGGMDGQFVQWEYKPDHGHFDYSEGNRRALCEYLRTLYASDAELQRAWGDDTVTLATARNPTPEEFKSQKWFDDRPGFGRRLADCRRFIAVGTAQTLNGFAKTIKRAWGRPAICESWWTTTIWSQPSRLALDELVKDGAFDMLATVSYYAPNRAVGGLGASANNTIASFNRRNLLYVQEFDHRTRRTQHVSAAAPKLHAIPSTAAEFDLQLTRDAASVIAAGGQGFYLYDMFGSWYHAKEEMATIGKLFAANAFAQRRAGGYEAPSVAIVMDESTRLLAETVAYNVPNAPWRTSGTMPAMHLLADVDAAFPDYRLVLLWNAVTLTKAQAAKLRELAERGALLVVVGRTGICSRDFADEAEALAALGPQLRRIESENEITDVKLNALAREAGARVYAEPGNLHYIGNGVAFVQRLAGEAAVDFGREVVLVDPVTGERSAPLRVWKPVLADKAMAFTCYEGLTSDSEHFPRLRSADGEQPTAKCQLPEP